MPDSETKSITAEVSAELIEQLDRYAESIKRPRDWVVAQALATWLESEREKDALTSEGLADVDAGRTVDHDEVRAWIESLDTDHPLPIPTTR
jgi:predicted transcriptional regulator